MTTLREAAQQALEVLEDACGDRCNAEHNPCWQREVAETLKAALAEPVQEQPVCDECGKHKRDGWALYCVDCVEPLFAPPQPPDSKHAEEKA